MRLPGLISGVAAVFLLAGPALPASERDWHDCQGNDWNARITACTRIIQGQGETAHDRSAAFVARGFTYSRKGELDSAIADYDEALQLEPTNTNAYNSRGLAYADKGDYDRAIADYNEAIRLVPHDFMYVRNRGNALYLAGKYDLAIADYGELITIIPTGDGLYGRGLAKLKTGDTAGGNADIAAAKALDADIAEQFAKNGIKP